MSHSLLPSCDSHVYTHKQILVLQPKWIPGRGHSSIIHIRAFAGFGSAEIDTNPDPFSPHQPNLTFHWTTFNWMACMGNDNRMERETRGTKDRLWYYGCMHHQSLCVLVKTLFDASLTLRQLPHYYIYIYI